MHRDAAGSAQRCTRFSTSANTSRCSASCKGWLMCRYHLSCLCHVTSLLSPTSTGDRTRCPLPLAPPLKHQHGFRCCLLSSGHLPRGAEPAAGAGRRDDSVSALRRRKRGCGMGKRGAGGFSMPYKRHNEDTVHVETSLIWKAIPDDVTSSSCQGAEHMPRAPQLGQAPRQLSWPLPDSVGQVKPGQGKPEEMLTLSHVG